MNIAETLSKPVGPLPLGAWVVVVGVGVGVNIYTRKEGGGGGGNEPEIVEDIGGVPGVGMGPGWVAVPPPSTPPDVADTAITTNEEWARKAINYLIAQGYDAALADSAVRRYLMSENLSVQEYALIRIALAKMGSLPIPLPPPITAVVPEQVAPTPAPAPAVQMPKPAPVFTPPPVPAPAPVPAPVAAPVAAPAPSFTPPPPVYNPPRPRPSLPGPWKRPRPVGRTPTLPVRPPARPAPVVSRPTPPQRTAPAPAPRTAARPAQNPHARAVSSFPAWARKTLTNGGTVRGGNGLTYRYDPHTSMAVPV